MDRTHVRLRFIETTLERYRNRYFDYHIRMALATSFKAFKDTWYAESNDCDFSRFWHFEQWERDNVSCLDCDKQTLVHSAVILGDFDIVKFFVDVADPEVLFLRDRFGRTPNDYADLFQDTVLMRYLLTIMQPHIIDDNKSMRGQPLNRE